MTRKGRNALIVVVVATAAVMTPLVLLGVYLGLYLGSVLGYSGTVLAIAFSTAGFIVGMAIIFRVIRVVVARVDSSSG